MKNATPQYNDAGRCIGQLLDTVSANVLNSSPGLQSWSVHKSPVMIFSAANEQDSACKNAQAHKNVLATLRLFKVPHKSATGAYRGKPERCIVARCDTDKHVCIVRALATARKQETILCLTSKRIATLETPQGKVVAELGTLKAVTREAAMRRDEYTFTNRTYYVCQ